MAGALKLLGIGGKDKGAALARQEAAAANRRQLAELARQNSQTDAAMQGQGGRRGGRTLLSFLSAEGASGLGAA